MVVATAHIEVDAVMAVVMTAVIAAVVVVVVVGARVGIESRLRERIASVEGRRRRRIDAGQPAAPTLGRGDHVDDVHEDHGPNDDVFDHGNPLLSDVCCSKRLTRWSIH
jgi:hypothetical protein